MTTTDRPLSEKVVDQTQREKRQPGQAMETASLLDDARKQLISSGYPEEVVNQILPNNLNQQRQHLVSALSVSYRSPLPPPGMLRAYYDITPKVGDRIMQITEENNRRFLNRADNLANTENATSLRGQIFAFCTVIFFMSGGIFLAYFLGWLYFSTFLAFGSLAALFINREFQHRQKSDKGRDKIGG